MSHRFDADKATQAAAVLLQCEGGEMESIRLLKLLYLAERQTLGETGRPITFSRTVAMDHGPLSSEVYDLIKGSMSNETWSRHIHQHAKSIKLRRSVKPGRLSKYEIQTLTTVAQDHESVGTWSLVEKTHALPEWEKNRPAPGSVKMIPVGDILEALGLGDRKNEILRDLAEKAYFDDFFAGAKK